MVVGSWPASVAVERDDPNGELMPQPTGVRAVSTSAEATKSGRMDME
jgi:hypothetical protein